MRNIVRALVFGSVLFGAGMLRAPAQDVFREYTFTYGASPKKFFAELDPDIKRVFTGQHARYNTMKRHVPRPITLDRAQAMRAEVSVEYFGGHIGTSGQRFRINGHEWHDVPQPVGTPAEPQRFFRTLLGNNAVPVPLAQLVDGENIFQFGAGRQIGYNSDWGYYWIYDFTVRVYYDALRPHPTGEILTPNVPERFTSRIGRPSPPCSIVFDGDLTRATSARLVVSSWSANTDDDSVHELRLNGERLANRFGQFHNYSFDSLDVPLASLKSGANVIDVFSTFKGHGIEINWPGPVLLVEFRQ